jgi:hypothetical protein
MWGRLQLNAVNGKLEACMGAAWSAVEVFDAAKNQLRVGLFGSGDVVNVAMVDGKARALTISGRTFQRVTTAGSELPYDLWLRLIPYGPKDTPRTSDHRLGGVVAATGILSCWRFSYEP